MNNLDRTLNPVHPGESYFNMSAEFWLGLQMDYDLDLARNALHDRLNREVKPRTVA
jgi:antitoxin HigA-1